jgi:hypothetical protein
MRKYFLNLILLLTFAYSNLFALNRDYKSECDEDDRYQEYYHPYCVRHVPCGYPTWIATDLIPFIPSIGPNCKVCHSRSSY